MVQPQPGTIHSASIRVPTIRGFIEASFTTLAPSSSERHGVGGAGGAGGADAGAGDAHALDHADGDSRGAATPPLLALNVTMPANTRADLCIPDTTVGRTSGGQALDARVQLRLDGVLTPAVRKVGYLCLISVGASAGPRRVTPT